MYYAPQFQNELYKGIKVSKGLRANVFDKLMPN